MSDSVKQSARKDVTEETRNIGSDSYDYDVLTYFGAFVGSLLVIAGIMGVLGFAPPTCFIGGGVAGLVSLHLTNVHFLRRSTIELICEALNPTSKEREELERTVTKSLLLLKPEIIKLPSRDVKKLSMYDYSRERCGKGFVVADPLTATHIQDRLVALGFSSAQELLTTRPNAFSVWEAAISAAARVRTAPTLDITKIKA